MSFDLFSSMKVKVEVHNPLCYRLLTYVCSNSFPEYCATAIDQKKEHFKPYDHSLSYFSRRLPLFRYTLFAIS